MRILIVDALSHARESLKTYLQLHDGIDVVGEAANGGEALQFSQALQPDIVIMDINLPERNGFDVAREIISQSPGLAVILLTTHLRDTDQQIADEVGAKAILEKSAGIEPIIDAIRGQESKQ